VQSSAGPITILYCLISDPTKLEGQVPLFISPRNRVAQLYPQVLVCLSVASYNSQGGILTHIHMGFAGCCCCWYYNQPSVSQSVMMSATPLGPMNRFYFFLFSLVWQLLDSWSSAPYLTRGWVYSLQCNHSLVSVAQDP
jgi:hypothetical protein